MDGKAESQDTAMSIQLPRAESQQSSSESLTSAEPLTSDRRTPSPTIRRVIDEQNNDQCTSDYLRMEDILALNQKVTCKFEHTLDKIGFIDPSSESEAITKGTKLELPLWMARELYANGLVSIEVPRGYNEAYREILEADANVVDLHKIAPNYYRFGQHLASLGHPEGEAIAKSLLNTFYQRLGRIMDNAASGSSVRFSESKGLYSNLENIELELFEIGNKTADEFRKWEDRTMEKMVANEVVAKLKKRKRAALKLK